MTKRKTAPPRPMPKIGALVYVEDKSVLGTIKTDLYTITVTRTHAVIKTPLYSYVVDNGCPTYLHWLGLIELYNKKDRKEEEDKLLDTLTVLYTNAINFHIAWFNDSELMKFQWEYHNAYYDEKLNEAMKADLQDDDPTAIQELKDMENLSKGEGLVV